MNTRSKIMTEEDALSRALLDRRRAGQRIVLTNGAFDVLHVGHVRALEASRALGDALIVALNTDASVRSNKGPGRPLVPGSERAEILAALACVDLVTFFSETTADELLRRIRPDVYAKGRDYGSDSLPEAATADELGVDVHFVGDEKTHSASDLIGRMRRLGGDAP